MEREVLRNRIIDVATAAFHKKGIKNVTMDDIAHELTISKRTLYQIFSDKEELLLVCVKKGTERDNEKMLHLLEDCNNVLDLLLASFAEKMHSIEKIQPEFFTDIMKYPHVVKFYEDKNRERESNIIAFLDKGKEQGFFRTDVNFHIIYKVLTQTMDLTQRMPELRVYSQAELFESTIVNLFRGCATLKGFEIIDAFMERFHNPEPALCTDSEQEGL